MQYDCLLSPEGIWEPIVATTVATMPDGRIARLYLTHEGAVAGTYLDAEEEILWNIDIGSAPFRGREQPNENGDDEE